MAGITAPPDSHALQRLDQAAAQLRCSHDEIIRQALDRFLEDLENPSDAHGNLPCTMKDAIQQAAAELHGTLLEPVHPSVDRFPEGFYDLSVAMARLRDPNDPVLDRDLVCHDLDLPDQDWRLRRQGNQPSFQT